MSGPSDSWYQPKDPVECCAEWEDDPGHDSEECLAEQAEAAAEARADREYDESRWER